MAHQVRGELAEMAIWTGDRLLSRRPELAQLLGVLCGQWSWLELNLSWLYATLLGKYMPHNQRKGPPVHPVGVQIFEALSNIHNRLELLERLASRLIPSDNTLHADIKGTLLPLIIKASKRRNLFIHSSWGISDEYPEALICATTTSNQWLVYDASDFSEAIDIIVLASHAISKFEIEVRKFLRRSKRPK